MAFLFVILINHICFDFQLIVDYFRFSLVFYFPIGDPGFLPMVALVVSAGISPIFPYQDYYLITISFINSFPFLYLQFRGFPLLPIMFQNHLICFQSEGSFDVSLDPPNDFSSNVCWIGLTSPYKSLLSLCYHSWWRGQ